MDKWTITEDEKRYIYQKGEYDRATHVIHSMLPHFQLEEWRKRVGEEEADRISQETAWEGELIHLITLYSDLKMGKDVEKLLNVYPWLFPHLLAWREWVEEYKVRWIAREKVYFSKKLLIAGKLDGVGYIGGNKYPTIADLKTGNLYDEIGIQVWGAYRELYNGSVPAREQARYALVIQLPRKEPGTLNTKDYTKERYTEKWREIREQYIKMYR